MKTFWNPKPPVWLSLFIVSFINVLIYRSHTYSSEPFTQILYSAGGAASSLLFLYPITHLVYWLWRTIGPNNSHH